MVNLFKESEEIVFREIHGDPIFDIYDDDDDDWIQDKHVDQFDACVVMFKHCMVDGFTPKEAFQVSRKERVGFTNQEEQTWASEKKEGVSAYGDMVIFGLNKSHSSHVVICQENMMDPHERGYYVYQLGHYYHRKKIRKRLFEDHG
ncbi:hypothetical protein Bca4012_027530 [Brassica carinata]